MRELNSREKNLGVMVMLICVPFLVTTVKKSLKKQSTVLNERLVASQQMIQVAEAELTKATTQNAAPQVAAEASGEEAKRSMTLLKDLTLPKETQSIRVMRVERTGSSSFRMEVQGEFPEMMKFLSYLERGDSRFAVASAEINRTATVASSNPAPGNDVAEATGPVENPRLIRAVFNLTTRS